MRLTTKEPEGMTKTTYPSDELEWLAGTLFNYAMDLYNKSQDEDCRQWVAKAIKVSCLCEDGGSLRTLLEDRYCRLRWKAD